MSATLNGVLATSATAHIPAWGVWWADVALSQPVDLSGDAVLVMSDLSLSGSIVAGGTSGDRAAYRIVGGKGKWQTALAAKSYANDAGIKLRTILLDASLAVGETLDVATIPEQSIGTQYVRDAGPAARLLSAYAKDAWYVGEDGVTRLGQRTPSAVGGTPGPVEEARQRVTVQSDSLVGFVPGATVGAIVALDVRLDVSEQGSRATLWGSWDAASTLASRFVRAVRACFPLERYRGVHEYRVVQQSDDLLDLQVVRVSSGLPDLQRVHTRPGVAGVRADVTLGSRCLVAFVDSEPTRPVVIAFEQESADGFAPLRLDLVGEDDLGVTGGSELGRVVRYGDPITFGSPGPGVVALPAPASLSRVRA